MVLEKMREILEKIGPKKMRYILEKKKKDTVEDKKDPEGDKKATGEDEKDAGEIEKVTGEDVRDTEE